MCLCRAVFYASHQLRLPDDTSPALQAVAFVDRYGIILWIAGEQFALAKFLDVAVTVQRKHAHFAHFNRRGRLYQQNVTVQALIFTREDESVLADFIIKQLGRSVTYWDGVGAYTKDDVRVLCVCLSKYEIEELLHMVHSVDPHAFLTVQEGVRVFGNFPRKLG